MIEQNEGACRGVNLADSGDAETSNLLLESNIYNCCRILTKIEDDLDRMIAALAKCGGSGIPSGGF